MKPLEAASLPNERRDRGHGRLYALYDADSRDHQAVRRAFAAIGGLISVPAAVRGEIDLMLREGLGADAELAFLASLRKGAFQLEEFTPADLLRCEELLETYRALWISGWPTRP